MAALALVLSILLVFGLSLWDQFVSGGGFGHAGDGVLGMIAALSMAGLIWSQPGASRIDRVLGMVFWCSVTALWFGYLFTNPDPEAASDNLGMYLTVPLVALSYAATLVHKVMVAWRRGLAMVLVNLGILAGTVLMPMFDYPVLFWSVVLAFLVFRFYESVRPPPVVVADEEDAV